MQKVIKENLSKYLSIFLILQPVLDMLTGICLHIFHLNITLGIIIRLLFLAFIGYITIFIYKKKKPLIYYIIFLIYMCFYCLGIYLYKDGVGLFTEMQGLLRVFYFPLLLLSLYEIKDEFKISKLTLFTTLSLYLLFIFIPVLFHVGFKSYEITKSGTLGFFNSANEISGIISILTPIIFIIFTTKKNPIINTIYTLTYLFVILTIGTKTPLLSLFITVGMTIIWLIIKSFKEKKYKMLLSSFLIIVISIIGLVIVIPKTNFYKNIMVHLDYLHIKDISDITENKEVIDHFIFSERITFFGAEKSRYLSTSSYEKLFGDGYLQDGKRVKDIEIDYYDIYFHHGIIGFLIFFIPYLYILFKVATEQKKKNYTNYMLNVSLLLAIVLSFFTGHIITSPAVSIFVIMIILSFEKDINNKLTKEKETKIVIGEEKNMATKEELVSIIVPIYNAEKYLNKCLDSLTKQTKKELEFILVNDGSIDKTEEIIKEYQDKRIKYFKNKNQGIGKTRNFGISKSSGKYLMFVDSDDYLEKDACEILYKKISKEEADLAICDFYKVYENGKTEEIRLPKFSSTTLKKTPSLINDINLSPWNKIYKRELITKNNLKFIENLKYEDAPFVINAMDKAKKIVKVDECLNYYVIHGNSETTVRDKKCFDILKIVAIIRENLKEKKYLKEEVDKLTVRILTNYTIQQRNQKDKKIGLEFVDEAFKYLKKEVPDYKKNKYYKKRGLLKRTIEKNKTLTKLYLKLHKNK